MGISTFTNQSNQDNDVIDSFGNTDEWGDQLADSDVETATSIQDEADDDEDEATEEEESTASSQDDDDVENEAEVEEEAESENSHDDDDDVADDSEEESIRGKPEKTGIDALDQLLQRVKPIPFSEGTKQDEYLIESVDSLLHLAEEQGLDIGIARDTPLVYDGSRWQWLEWRPFLLFVQVAVMLMGVPRRFAKLYSFVDKLKKQFIATARPVSPETNTSKINLRNGTLHITAGGVELKPFDKQDGLTYQLDYDFDPTANAPIFKKFLDRALPDKALRKLLFQYVAYVFLRHMNLEKVLFLYGGGANGKSVFINVIKGLVGKEQCCSYSLEGITKKEGQAAQLGKYLLNVSTENAKGMRADAFKKYVSRETMQVRNLYNDPHNLDSYATSIFAMNELPKVQEQTKAFFRRFIIIPFDVQIPEEEQDPDLARKIIESEMSGVLNYVVKGAKTLIRDGKFDIPPVVEMILETFRLESDSVQMFLRENRYRPSLTEHILLRELYRVYRVYCLESGITPESKITFAKRLRNQQVPYIVREHGGKKKTVVFAEQEE
jgi:putative DNA primase/helicase